MKLVKTLKVFVICWTFLFSSIAYSSEGPLGFIRSTLNLGTTNSSGCRSSIFETLSQGVIDAFNKVRNITTNQSCQNINNRLHGDSSETFGASQFGPLYNPESLCQELESEEAISCSRYKMDNQEYESLMRGAAQDEGLFNAMTDDFQEKISELIRLSKKQHALNLDPLAVLNYTNDSNSENVGEDILSCQMGEITNLMNGDKTCADNPDVSQDYYNRMLNQALANCREGDSNCPFSTAITNDHNHESIPDLIKTELDTTSAINLGDEELTSLTSEMTSSMKHELVNSILNQFVNKAAENNENVTYLDVIDTLKSYRDSDNPLESIVSFFDDESLRDDIGVQVFASRLMAEPDIRSESFASELYSDETIRQLFSSREEADRSFQNYLSQSGLDTNREVDLVSRFKAKEMSNIVRDCNNLKNDIKRMFCGSASIPTRVSQTLLSRMDFSRDISFIRGSDNFHRNLRVAQMHCLNISANELRETNLNLQQIPSADSTLRSNAMAGLNARCEEFNLRAQNLLSDDLLTGSLSSFNCSEIIVDNSNTDGFTAQRPDESSDGAAGSQGRQVTPNTLAASANSTALSDRERSMLEGMNNAVRNYNARRRLRPNNGSTIIDRRVASTSPSNSQSENTSGAGLNNLMGPMTRGMMGPMSVPVPETSEINSEVERLEERRDNLSSDSQAWLDQLAQMTSRINSLEGQLAAKEREANRNEESRQDPRLQRDIDRLRRELEMAKRVAQSKVEQINENESRITSNNSVEIPFQPPRRTSSNSANTSTAAQVAPLPSSALSGGSTSGPSVMSSSGPQSLAGNASGSIIFSSGPISTSTGYVNLSSEQIQSYSVIRGYDVAQISQQVALGRPVVVETEDGKLLCEKNENVRDGISCKRINILDEDQGGERAIAEEERVVPEPQRDRSRYDVLKDIIDREAGSNN